MCSSNISSNPNPAVVLVAAGRCSEAQSLYSFYNHNFSWGLLSYASQIQTSCNIGVFNISISINIGGFTTTPQSMKPLMKMTNLHPCSSFLCTWPQECVSGMFRVAPRSCECGGRGGGREIHETPTSISKASRGR